MSPDAVDPDAVDPDAVDPGAVSPGVVVRVERLVRASPGDVFDAWTDPVAMAAWMAPEPARVGHAECDPRVGGAFRVVMVDGSGSLEHHGVFAELVRPELLVLTWRGAHLGEAVTLVTVRLTAVPGGTWMVIEHAGLPGRAAGAHEAGWESIAARLAALLRPA